MQKLIRDQFLKDISDYLGIIAYQVDTRNSIHLYDLNISAEDFYNGLLNHVYGLNLINMNIENPNTKAIDLGDRTARICIQVTSEKGV